MSLSRNLSKNGEIFWEIQFSQFQIYIYYGQNVWKITKGLTNVAEYKL